MKNSLFFLCAFYLLQVSPLHAQVALQLGTAYYQGHKKLITTNSLSTQSTREKSLDGLLSLYPGVSYRKQLGVFAIQPELNYSKKGGKIKDAISGCGILGCFTGDLPVDLRYLELPVYILYTGPQKGSFYCGAGPALNYLMNGKYNEEEMQIGNDKSIARMHLAVNVLVGSRPKKRLGIHAYFSQSITKSSATYTSPFVDNTGNYTSYISEYSFTNFGLRFSFRLGKLAK